MSADFCALRAWKPTACWFDMLRDALAYICRYDKNGDGQLDASEMQAMLQDRAAAILAAQKKN